MLRAEYHNNINMKISGKNVTLEGGKITHLPCRVGSGYLKD